MDQIKNWDIAKPISSWLMNYLHRVMTNGLASTDGYEIRARYRAPYHRGRGEALTGRLINAMILLDPGFVVEEDRKELVEILTLCKQSSRNFPSEDVIAREK